MYDSESIILQVNISIVNIIKKFWIPRSWFSVL